MNILIMTDAEGISGVYSREQVLPDQRRFTEGRRMMTRDVNVVAEACHAAGVDEVYVRDGHGGSYMLIWEELSDAVDYAICGGSGDRRYPAIDKIDAVILLGYHAMAGTPRATLEHTMSSTSVQNYWLNGEKIGEIALDAAILTECGKPVIMVSGDDAACAEAKRFLPGVCTAEVKEGLTCFGAILRGPGKCKEILTETTKAAVEKFRRGETHFYPVSHPVTFRAEFTERTQLPNPNQRPYLKYIDGRTIETTSDSVLDALWKIL